MRIADLPSLLEFLKDGSCKRVCLLDNNLTEKLVQVKDTITYERVFGHYDLLLIPEWVYVEICDGDGRREYVEGLLNGDLLKCFVVSEKDYSLLSGYKELELYFIVLKCSNKLGSIRSYIRKNVLDPKAAYTAAADDMEDYENWITDMYESREAFYQETIGNGRIKRKNAGELSICILAAILSIYFQAIEGITIFSFDKDTYLMLKEYKEEIVKEALFSRHLYKPITFKSNNVLLHEWVSDGFVSGENISRVMGCMRGSQGVRYTLRLKDGSIEEQNRVMANDEFADLISQDVHIIY